MNNELNKDLPGSLANFYLTIVSTKITSIVGFSFQNCCCCFIDYFINKNHIKVFLKIGDDKTPTPSPDPTPPPSPKSPTPDTPKEIVVGSKVKWTKGKKDFKGEIVKISPKTYKICCKPGKTEKEIQRHL